MRRAVVAAGIAATSSYAGFLVGYRLGERDGIMRGRLFGLADSTRAFIRASETAREMREAEPPSRRRAGRRTGTGSGPRGAG